LHAEYALGLDTGQRRAHRNGTGGDDQVVEALGVAAASSQFPNCDPASAQVDLLDLGEHAQVDAVAPMLLRRPNDQQLLVLHVAGNPVGDAARRVRAVFPAFKADH
jgi:hypothetical protein